MCASPPSGSSHTPNGSARILKKTDFGGRPLGLHARGSAYLRFTVLPSWHASIDGGDVAKFVVIVSRTSISSGSGDAFRQDFNFIVAIVDNDGFGGAASGSG